MKIAVGLVQPTLQSQMDLEFGRTNYFGIVDTFWGIQEILNNPFNFEAQTASAAELADWLIREGVDVVITGLCEMNAFHHFDSHCIPVYEGFFGTGAAALRQFKLGKLKNFEKLDVN